MKFLKLNTRKVQNNSDLIQIKRSFIYEINKPRTFKGKPLEYSNKYISNEECWLKFVAGSKHNNPDRKINNSRVASILWIFEIIDIFYKNSDPTIIYSNIQVIPYINNKFKFEIVIDGHNYYMYFEKKGYIDSITSELVIEKYVLLSAFKRHKKHL